LERQSKPTLSSENKIDSRKSPALPKKMVTQALNKKNGKENEDE